MKAKMPMVKKGDKMVPAFAADGKGKMKNGGAKKSKMMAGGTKPKAMYGMSMKPGMMKKGGAKKK